MSELKKRHNKSCEALDLDPICYYHKSEGYINYNQEYQGILDISTYLTGIYGISPNTMSIPNSSIQGAANVTASSGDGDDLKRVRHDVSRELRSRLATINYSSPPLLRERLPRFPDHEDCRGIMTPSVPNSTSPGP